jgi:hypothetical protein
MWDCQSVGPSVHENSTCHTQNECACQCFPLSFKCPHVTRKAGGDLKQRLGVRLHSDGELSHSVTGKRSRRVAGTSLWHLHIKRKLFDLTPNFSEIQ